MVVSQGSRKIRFITVHRMIWGVPYLEKHPFGPPEFVSGAKHCNNLTSQDLAVVTHIFFFMVITS